MQHVKISSLLSSDHDMAMPAFLDDTDYPDDNQLKTEIDEISSRIDRIMKTVKDHFPVCKTEIKETEPEDDAAAQDEG